MKMLSSKYDVSLLNELPVVTFPGKIEVIKSEYAAQRAVDFLLKQPIIGIDTETRPSFKKNLSYDVALLQVATHDICFLFRLSEMGFPECLIHLLSDTSVLKVGLSLHDDVSVLRRRKDFMPGNFWDLQKMVGEFGIEDRSLQKLYANVFGQKISKAQRLTNWEADTLTDKQKMYAAIDAWACIRLYEFFADPTQFGVIKTTDTISDLN